MFPTVKECSGRYGQGCILQCFGWLGNSAIFIQASVYIQRNTVEAEAAAALAMQRDMAGRDKQNLSRQKQTATGVALPFDANRN